MSGEALASTPGKPRWYLVLTEHRSENLVAHELSVAGFATVLPMKLEERRAIPARMLTRRQRLQPVRYVTKPVLCFPGYAFVEFDRFRDPWRRIVRSPGVRRLFQSGEQSPTPLPEGVVEKWRDRGVAVVEPAIAAADRPIEPGTRLRIEDGPLSSFPGVCLWSDAMRVTADVMIFGRLTKTELLRCQVSVAAGPREGLRA